MYRTSHSPNPLDGLDEQPEKKKQGEEEGMEITLDNLTKKSREKWESSAAC